MVAGSCRPASRARRAGVVGILPEVAAGRRPGAEAAGI